MTQVDSFTREDIDRILNRKQRQKLMTIAVRAAKTVPPFEHCVLPVLHPPGSFGEILEENAFPRADSTTTS